MRVLFLMFLCLCLNAKSITIDNFESDLYSKTGGLKKIELKLKILGDDVESQVDYIKDGLNMVISSYFYEDIFTETGKENLKKTLIKYLGKKHSVNIDEVLIISLKSKDNAEIIKNILKEANLL